MSILPDPSSKLSKMWTKIKNIERSLFPELREQLGILSSKEERLIKILDFAQIENSVTVVKITNPPKDREAMARAFVAKSVYNLQTTRDLIDRLRIDRTLRVLCGWRFPSQIPSESKFSRVFKEFTQCKLAQKAHERFIESYLSDTLFFYSANDSTAIPLRQKPEKKAKVQPINLPLLQRQKEMNETEEMISLLCTRCSVGIKKNARGHREKWIGGKLHLAVVDGDIPIVAIYTGASVHDSSVALPLMRETAQRVKTLYDLMDAAYDATIIKEYSAALGHRPIVDINPRNSTKLKAQKELLEEEKKRFSWLDLPFSSDTHHYNQRSMVERVNAYLKDNFGCDRIYYQGADKVASVLAFGILSICIHQSLKLVT